MGLSQNPSGSDRPEAFGAEVFASQGRRALAEQGDDMFPAGVRPAFLRLLWVSLAATGALIAAAVYALTGRLA